MSGATQEEDKKPADQIHINLKVKGQLLLLRGRTSELCKPTYQRYFEGCTILVLDTDPII